MSWVCFGVAGYRRLQGCTVGRRVARRRAASQLCQGRKFSSEKAGLGVVAGAELSPSTGGGIHSAQDTNGLIDKILDLLSDNLRKGFVFFDLDETLIT